MQDLSDSLTRGRLKPPYSTLAIGSCIPNYQAELVKIELDRMHLSGLQPIHIAAVLELLATERESSQHASNRLQLVWTGPDVPGCVARDTGVVVRELLSSAKKSVLLSTYAIRRGRQGFAPLAAAIQQNPRLQVRLVVNIGRSGDYASSEHQLLSRFAEEFWTEHWPWSDRPQTYYDPRSLSMDRSHIASLHAKCIVVDDEISFITSANFTEWAQERNVEAGVLIRDVNFASVLRQQFDGLISASHLCLLPGSTM